VVKQVKQKIPVQLDNVHEKNIDRNNPHRSRYMMDFVEGLEPQLKETVARKYQQKKQID